jgi:hypothetical protein
MEIEINRTASSSVHLEGLNACFPHWGGEQMYDWCFARDAGAGAADLMILRVHGEPAAGSAVVYRHAGWGDETFTVGIMCASWTLPAARRQGCFTRVIDESLALCRARGAAWLIAFVTEANSSRRRLQAAGAHMVPTAYCVGTAERRDGHVLELRDLDSGPEPFARQLERFQRCRTSQARFRYPTREHFYQQMVARALPTSCLRIGDKGFAVVERAEDTDRLLLLATPHGDPNLRPRCVEALAQHAAMAGRKLFCFATTATDREIAEAVGLKIIPGFVTVLASGITASHDGSPPVTPTQWFLESGDRM